MGEDLAALFKLLDSHIKGNSDLEDDQLKRFLCTLEKKYEKQKEFIHNLGCNAHVGVKEDEMANALIPEDLPESGRRKLASFGSDGCAVMTGAKNGVWGLLRNDSSTTNFKEFWCGAHRVELAVVKSLQHFEEFNKLRETLQSLYKEYHYSPKALRELRELAEALEEKV